jgi:4,5:9,10-diseco-3-hydroxy-5,9,17-trioxoandrosta-1(10),2-diene-4-oate hydrolase
MTALTYESTSRFVQVGSTRVHYHEAGEGPALLCLHGGGAGANGWSNFGRNVEGLAQHFRVIVLDLPGYGRSDMPDATSDLNGFHARTVAAMLKELGVERAHVLGLATGGGVAIRLAVDHPEVLQDLILVSSAGGYATYQLRSERTASQGYYGGDGPSVEKMRAYLERLVFNTELITDELVRERYEASLNRDSSVRGGKPQIVGRHTPPDLWKRLDEIQARTLIVWGRENRLHSFENAVFMLSRIRRAQLHIFGECGFWVPYERRDEFNDLVIQFLTAGGR